MLDTIKLLNQFNAAARNLQHEEINNLGNHILELGENEYPVSVLAAVETRVNNNKRICHSYQAIIESMGEEEPRKGKVFLALATGKVNMGLTAWTS